MFRQMLMPPHFVIPYPQSPTVWYYWPLRMRSPSIAAVLRWGDPSHTRTTTVEHLPDVPEETAQQRTKEKAMSMDHTSRPPLPPFTFATATQKVRLAEDAWNSRDPDRVVLAYTEDSQWRNRDEFFTGREAIRAFLQEELCDRLADARGAAAHHGALAAQSSHLVVSPWIARLPAEGPPAG